MRLWGGRVLLNEQTLFSIQYLPLIIRLKCCETAVLPPYLGSMLHGALGWALQSNRAVYHYLFENASKPIEGRDIVNPYILDIPRYRAVYNKGEELRFQFTLLGTAVNYAADFVRALVGVGILGLGAERKKFELTEIIHGTQLRTIWTNEKPNVITRLKAEVLLDEVQINSTHCAITLLTPLRIRRSGNLLMVIDFQTIIRNITNRISRLTERYGGLADKDAMNEACEYSGQIREATCEISLCNIERYSNRRSAKLDWSGLMGTMVYEGTLDLFTPWLNAARVLHIGRNVTFGYGRIDTVFW